MARIKPSIFILLLSVLLIIGYGFTAPYPLVFDDISGVEQNFAIRSLTPPLGPAFSPKDTTPYGRPVTAYSFAVNYAVGKLNPGGFRLVNVALHGAVAMVIWQLFALLGERAGLAHARLLAMSTALVWAVHPLCTSAVTYVVQRAEILMALCYVSTLWFSAGFLQSGRRIWMFLAFACCGLGMGAKESMVTCPVAVLLMHRAFFAPSWRMTVAPHVKFYAGLFASWLLLAAIMTVWPRTQSVGFGHEGVGAFEYALMQLQVLAHYLRLVVFPVGLSLDYYWSKVQNAVELIPALLVLGSYATLGAWAARRDIRLGWLLAMPLLILLPTSSVVPIVTAVAAEHRMYLPLAFIVAFAVFAACRLRRKFAVRGEWVAIFTVIGLLTLTVLRNFDYRSADAIWADVVSKQPTNVRALINLGLAKWRAGTQEEAESLLRRALELEPAHADACYNLGTFLGQTDRPREALEMLKSAIQARPDYAAAYANIGVILAGQNLWDEAIRNFEECLKHDPGHIPANLNLAMIRRKQGDLAGAKRHIQKVLHIDPGQPQARSLAAKIDAEIGE